jgi:TetR/AcrR family transcriptional repressor of nem operon
MRYPSEHKQQTHERIVRAASRRFRSRGSEGAGIGDLMRDLRLTHGGFYRHFGSKEELFAEAFQQALRDATARSNAAIQRAAPGEEIKAIIDTYLDVDHCNDIAGGCPVAALAAEVARRPRASREPLIRALRAHVDRLAKYMPGKTDEERRRKTGVPLSGMAGTLTIARAFPTDEERRTILDNAKHFYFDAVRRE